MGVYVLGYHNRIEPSMLLVANIFLSAENAKAVTLLAFPVKVKSRLPVRTSHE